MIRNTTLHASSRVKKFSSHHRLAIFLIAAFAVFQDLYVARKMPELAVGSKRGGIWRDRKGLPFIDPGADYGVAEVELQKKAVRDAGLNSWMAWDPSNRYTKEAYQTR